VPGRVQGVGGVPGGAGRPGGRGARGTSPGAAAAAALADTPRLCYQLLLGSLPAARVGVGQHAACCGGAVQALNWIAQTLGHGTYGCCSANAPTHPPLLPLDPWPPCLPPLFSLLCLPAGGCMMPWRTSPELSGGTRQPCRRTPSITRCAQGAAGSCACLPAALPCCVSASGCQLAGDRQQLSLHIAVC
jgi:hypothetical protein